MLFVVLSVVWLINWGMAFPLWFKSFEKDIILLLIIWIALKNNIVVIFIVLMVKWKNMHMIRPQQIRFLSCDSNCYVIDEEICMFNILQKLGIFSYFHVYTSKKRFFNLISILLLEVIQFLGISQKKPSSPPLKSRKPINIFFQTWSDKCFDQR